MQSQKEETQVSDQQRVAITGATGFVGKNIVLEALIKGKIVYAFSRFKNEKEKEAYKEDIKKLLPEEHKNSINQLFVHEINLTKGNEYIVKNFLNEMKIDAVIHALGQASVKKSYQELEDLQREKEYENNPEVVRQTETGKTNVDTTEVLLEALKTVPQPVSFVLISTGDVFTQKQGPINSNTLHTPNTPYGQTKEFAEQSLQKAVETSEHITGSVLYGPIIYGPNQRPIAMVPILIDKFLKGEPVELRGNPERETDAIGVSDFAKIAVAAALQEGDEPLSRYVISGHRIKIKDVFDLIVAALKAHNIEVNYRIQRLANEAPSDQLIDDSHTAKHFKEIYQNMDSLKKIIDEAVNAAVQNHQISHMLEIKQSIQQAEKPELDPPCNTLSR